MKTYQITELARHFGLSRSTLLYYDRIGLLHPNARTDADYRIYTHEDFGRLERICFYRNAGLCLEDITDILDCNTDDCSILEKRLREIGQEITALKAQQQLIAGVLKTVAAGYEASGLDRKLWISLQKACGLDDSALKQWHTEFERRSPGGHHTFLLNLGLSEKEAIQVRMLTRNVEVNTLKMNYFYELFEELPRQGPGCRDATLRALKLLKNLPPRPEVLDIGCGNGLQTQILAQELKTSIIAIDNHRPILNNLNKASEKKGLAIKTFECSMFNMPFERERFDLLWSEGSIFIIGLDRGIKEFRNYLKPGGYLAFTEMCLFVKDPPSEVRTFFNNVYPDICYTDDICKKASDNGYQVLEYFNLPENAWWDDYYTPMLERIRMLRVKNAGIPEAEAVYSEAEFEAGIYRRYSKSYGYTFFVLQKELT
ncbi:MAG: methyltransferase domain-containing protein [Chitinispirillaceae bacterium]|nr:methyltransferase domain-containing protein [Chitinispirillaceae bacterium]